MVAGGVQLAPVSLPEARPLIDAGKVRALAVMADKRVALYQIGKLLRENFFGEPQKMFSF
ncbi:MAG: hypothetical protein ACXWF4_03745 [Candidatus Aminicenantales bacterium]